MVVVLGFANLLADGLSMGLGDAVSTTAENTLVKNEYEREMWETGEEGIMSGIVVFVDVSLVKKIIWREKCEKWSKSMRER